MSPRYLTRPGRRAAPRTIATRIRDVLGALAERRGGRHTRQETRR